MKFLNQTFIVLCFLFLVACGGSENVTPQASASIATEVVITPTLDPCIEPTLTTEVAKVNKLMREFDDYSTLASNTPQTQLVVIIPELQRVLREAEDQVAPACLLPLKKLQIDHMTVVVQTLLVFMGNSDPTFVNENIVKARDLHQQYDIELARLLGITLQVTTPISTTDASVSPTAPPPPVVKNPSTNDLNLRTSPDFTSATPAVLAVGASTIALGRTADNLWIQVEIPNQPGVLGWVYASNVELSVPIEQLPIVAP